MKKLAMLIVTVAIMLVSAITVFAGDYTIYDAYWDTSYDAGTVVLKWDKCAKSTKYEVVIHRKALGSTRGDAGTPIQTKKVSGSKLDCTSLIKNKGTGIYMFSVRPVNSPNSLDDMYVGDELEIDSDFLSRIREGSGSSSDSDTPPKRNGWVQTPGSWKYARVGEYVKNQWMTDKGFWYYFNGNGDMLTGWQWINHKCYYLTPIEGLGGYPQGACWMGRITPDGYTVDATGAWTVNGVVQKR